MTPTPRLTTARLVLTPITTGDAAEMTSVLADPDLYAFIGGSPPSQVELEGRYRGWETGGVSGVEEWHNWVVRLGGDGRAVGTMQATVYPRRRSADVAWVIGRDWQGRGLASEAARSVVAWLLPDVDEVKAHIHPQNEASERVAAKAGLEPTDVIDGGEVVWHRSAGDAGNRG